MGKKIERNPYLKEEKPDLNPLRRRGLIGSDPFPHYFEPTYTRRKMDHDYRGVGTYHIILKKAKGCPDFGEIVGDAKIAPGLPGSANTKWSDIGRTIANCLYGFHDKFPMIDIYCYCVMPDHVHILLHKNRKDKYHLGYFISHLKAMIAKGYGWKKGVEISSETIFQINYTDKIIFPWRSLEAIRTYIRENPHRRAMMNQYPEFFKRVNKLKIGNRLYQAYGNLFLFRNPDKEAVVVSSKFSEEENSRLKKFWIEAAQEKTVMVSPFVSKPEKALREQIEALGAPIIFITHEAFPEKFRPAEHDFKLCCQGRLLIVSLGMKEKTRLSRKICMEMNELARELGR